MSNSGGRKKAWIILDPGWDNQQERLNEPTELRIEIKFDDDGAFFRGRLVFPLHHCRHGRLDQHRITAEDLYVFYFSIGSDQQLHTCAAGDVVPSGQFRILGLNTGLYFASVGLSQSRRI